MPSTLTVEVVAEQLFYSVPNGDGTHTTSHYVRGQVLEMNEKDALAAAEGEVGGPPEVRENGVGTPVWVYPRKTPGAARAAVRILKEPTKISKPLAQEKFVPAPEPKPGGAK
jgi:hypothetical protein